ncbi:MAG: hypothetical protein FWF88_06755 [Peptococcaceae bacterium]|nr:hypothetical protein [Peptococcaceae bacterium]
MDIMWARNSPEVGFGERETPKARELFSPFGGCVRQRGFWILPLTKPYLGTVTGQRGICLQLTIELRENTATESSAYPYRQFLHF